MRLHLWKIVIIICSTIDVIKARKCPGFKQSVVIPDKYVKSVPDALYPGNITDVTFWFYIKHIDVTEER